MSTPITHLYKIIDKIHIITFLFISDINECESSSWNDCSLNAECINLEGRYNCSCNTGYLDISGDPSYPGRSCAGIYVFSLCDFFHVMHYLYENEVFFIYNNNIYVCLMTIYYL